jgi:hypothetical protein
MRQAPSADEHLSATTATISSVDTNLLLDIVRGLATPPYEIYRTAVVPFNRSRRENDAEHSFSLGLVAMCLAPLVDETLDTGLIAKYALIHDLPEIYSGDISVYADAATLASKPQLEKEAREKMAADFGDSLPWLIDAIERYERLEDGESRFVYALDKMLPHALIVIGDHHPVKPRWDDYKATEDVARAKIERTFPALVGPFEELCREFARRPHLFSSPPPR